MKKLFTFITILFFAINTKAQTIVLCEDFLNYDTTTAAADYHGFSLNYYTVTSYYTSTQSSGISGPNSYKFGKDSATMITPDITGADHISFFMKGNASTGGSLANGAFYIYQGPDTNNMTQLDMITPIPAGVSQTKQYTLLPGTAFVKFYYDKDSGNVAFDDFCATIGPVGVNELYHNNALSVYPNPSKGLTTINFNGNHLSNSTLIFSNVIGKEIKKINLKGTESSSQVDLSDFPDGIYFVKLKSDTGEKTQRIILRK